MKYTGIDLSLTNTGIVVLNDSGSIYSQRLIKTKSSENIEDRIYYIYNEINNLLIDYNNMIINIEGLSFGSKGNAIMQLAGLHYYVRINFNLIGVKYKIIPPTILKKYITGKANCKKNLILLQIYKKFMIEFDDDNIADSYVLARMAYEMS